MCWRGGWQTTPHTGFRAEALDTALRTATPGISNAGQGTQLTNAAFTDRLHAAGARCSMDGRLRCLDNAFIERLWRSLKYETAYLRELPDGFAPERLIAAWMTFHSHVRPHSALRGLTPANLDGDDRTA